MRISKIIIYNYLHSTNYNLVVGILTSTYFLFDTFRTISSKTVLSNLDRRDND